MEYALLGWPEDGPTLRLDYREFSYAGKFVMSSTGKAVVLADDASAPAAADDEDDTGDEDGPDDDYAEDVLAAVSFDEDRTDPSVCRIRYVTVRSDRRGAGIGPRLVAFLAGRARDRGYERLRIAVNNPFAYQALYRAGFHFTGEETGVAELVLDRPLGDSDGSGSDSAEKAVKATDPDRSRSTYQAGLDVYRERAGDPDAPELSADERTFLDEKLGADPPEPIEWSA